MPSEPKSNCCSGPPVHGRRTVWVPFSVLPSRTLKHFSGAKRERIIETPEGTTASVALAGGGVGATESGEHPVVSCKRTARIAHVIGRQTRVSPQVTETIIYPPCTTAARLTWPGHPHEL